MAVAIRLIALVIGYFFGAFQTGYIYGKLHGIDIREHGSGNAGATNTLRTLGFKAGVITFAGDCLKSVIAILLVTHFFGAGFEGDARVLGLYAGLGAVLGHNFPFYLKFNGGKGFASFIGAILALNFKAGAIIVICAIIAALIVNYMVGATTTVIVASPIVFSVLAHSFVPGLILLVASLIIAIKHIENYVRIYNGTEFRLRKAFVKKPDYNA